MFPIFTHISAYSCYETFSLKHIDDPFGDPKVIGDPYCTVFVGRLSLLTTESTLRKAMSKYGRVKNLRLVRHIGDCFSSFSTFDCFTHTNYFFSTLFFNAPRARPVS